MPYDYRIIPEQNLLLITGSGRVTSADIHRVVIGFQRDPTWRPTMNMLVDWREVRELRVDHDEVQALASEALDPERMALETPLGPKAAVVLANHDHAGVPMLYYSYLRKSRLKAKIFFAMEEAAKWLEVDPTALAFTPNE